MWGFDPPKVIRTEVFATLPDQFRENAGQKTDRIRPRSGVSLEGPSFDRDGNLYITDIPNGRIFRISPSGEWTLVVKYKGEPNGLKIHKDGRIFVADRDHGIMLLDPQAGKIETFVAGPDKERFKGVNDLVFTQNGDLYFTDQGGTGLHDPTGRVYRLSAGGELTCLIDTIPSPNSIVLNKAETTIFVAVTRANAVWLVPMNKRSGISKVGLFTQLPSPGPDGMAADDKGNLAVCHPGLGIVWVFDRTGLPVYRVESCTGKQVLNLAYGGEDNRWLYITESESGTVIRAEMPVPGRRMYSHA